MYLFFAIVAAFGVLQRQGRTWYESAVYGLALGMGLSAVDHLLFCDWYVSVMSEWIPNRQFVVQLSAVTRLILAALLLVPRTQHFALIVSLVLMIAVSQVNWRLAFHGSEIPAAAEIPSFWLMTRFVLHLCWIGWIIFALELLRLVLREQNEQEPVIDPRGLHHLRAMPKRPAPEHVLPEHQHMYSK